MGAGVSTLSPKDMSKMHEQYHPTTPLPSSCVGGEEEVPGALMASPASSTNSSPPMDCPMTPGRSASPYFPPPLSTRRDNPLLKVAHEESVEVIKLHHHEDENGNDETSTVEATEPDTDFEEDENDSSPPAQAFSTPLTPRRGPSRLRRHLNMPSSTHPAPLTPPPSNDENDPYTTQTMDEDDFVFSAKQTKTPPRLAQQAMCWGWPIFAPATQPPAVQIVPSSTTSNDGTSASTTDVNFTGANFSPYAGSHPRQHTSGTQGNGSNPQAAGILSDEGKGCETPPPPPPPFCGPDRPYQSEEGKYGQQQHEQVDEEHGDQAYNVEWIYHAASSCSAYPTDFADAAAEACSGAVPPVLEFCDPGKLSPLHPNAQRRKSRSVSAQLDAHRQSETDQSQMERHERKAEELKQRDKLMKRAESHEARGEHGRALDCYYCCLEMDKTSSDENGVSFREREKNVADTLHKIGVVKWKEGSYDASLETLHKSLDIYRRMQGVITADETELGANGIRTNCEADALGGVLNSAGKVHLSRGNYAAAMKSFEEAHSLLMIAYGSNEDSASRRTRKSQIGNDIVRINHPLVALTTINIGTVHDARGKHSRAMRYFAEGLRSQRACLGNNHVDVAATLNSIGTVHERGGKHSQAMDCFTEALWIYRTCLGNNHVDVAVTLTNVGMVHAHWGEYDEAVKVYNEALAVTRSVLGPKHRNVASILHSIGQVHVARGGDQEEALKIYKDVLDIQRSVLGKNHVDIAVTFDSIGAVFEAKGKLKRAQKCYSRALRVRRAALGGGHLFVAVTLDRLGRFHMERTGDMDEATRRFAEAKALYKANRLSEDDDRLRLVAVNMSRIRNLKIAEAKAANASFSSLDTPPQSGRRVSSRRRQGHHHHHRSSRRKRAKNSLAQ